MSYKDLVCNANLADASDIQEFFNHDINNNDINLYYMCDHQPRSRSTLEQLPTITKMYVDLHTIHLLCKSLPPTHLLHTNNIKKRISITPKHYLEDLSIPPSLFHPQGVDRLSLYYRRYLVLYFGEAHATRMQHNWERECNKYQGMGLFQYQNKTNMQINCNAVASIELIKRKMIYNVMISRSCFRKLRTFVNEVWASRSDKSIRYPPNQQLPISIEQVIECTQELFTTWKRNYYLSYIQKVLSLYTFRLTIANNNEEEERMRVGSTETDNIETVFDEEASTAFPDTNSTGVDIIDISLISSMAGVSIRKNTSSSSLSSLSHASHSIMSSREIVRVFDSSHSTSNLSLSLLDDIDIDNDNISLVVAECVGNMIFWDNDDPENPQE